MNTRLSALVEADVEAAKGDGRRSAAARSSSSRSALGQRPGVEQGHVGALAELRAGRMPGVADVDQAGAGRVAQRAVGVAGEGEASRPSIWSSSGAVAGQRRAPRPSTASRPRRPARRQPVAAQHQKKAAWRAPPPGARPTGSTRSSTLARR